MNKFKNADKAFNYYKKQILDYGVDFDNSKALFEGLVEILSISEVKGILENHFKEILDEIYQ